MRIPPYAALPIAAGLLLAAGQEEGDSSTTPTMDAIRKRHAQAARGGTAMTHESAEPAEP